MRPGCSVTIVFDPDQLNGEPDVYINSGNEAEEEQTRYRLFLWARRLVIDVWKQRAASARLRGAA